MGFVYCFTARIILFHPDLSAETFFPPKCIQNVAALLFSLASLAVTSLNTKYFLCGGFSVHFYSKDFLRDVCCGLFIALPSFASPSYSHLLVFRSSHVFSLLDCDLGHPLSKKRIWVWNVFKL